MVGELVVGGCLFVCLFVVVAAGAGAGAAGAVAVAAGAGAAGAAGAAASSHEQLRNNVPSAYHGSHKHKKIHPPNLLAHE